jgi:branched-subunit amino acid transport protein
METTPTPPLTEFLLIAGMFLVTFLARYPLLVIVGRVELPQRVFQGLRYVPVAVLTAICIPAMVMPNKVIDIGLTNAALIGGIAAILIAWRTKSLLPTIIGGMGIFLLWRALFPVAPIS